MAGNINLLSIIALININNQLFNMSVRIILFYYVKFTMLITLNNRGVNHTYLIVRYDTLSTELC